MSNSNPVQDLFPEERTPGAASEVLGMLGKHAILNLAYDGDPGRNPGYIFRGELDYPYPLQCSLERIMRDKLNNGEILTGQQMREKEEKLITKFIGGDGGRVAGIIAMQSDGHISQPSEVYWWLSVMQHYEHPTRLIDFTRDIRFALFFAVEQLYKNRTNHKCLEKPSPDKDLIIYCFPCKDLKFPKDRDNNKSPIEFDKDGHINMHDALGKQIGLPDFRDKCMQPARQKFGWDRPNHQNPRLGFQRGMFVYPYEYPDIALGKNTNSWLIQNLRTEPADRCKIRALANDLPAKRIRIASEHAAELKDHLKERYGLTPATVYVDYTKAEIGSDRETS